MHRHQGWRGALVGITVLVAARGAAAQTAPVVPLEKALTGDAKSAYDAAKLLFGDGDFAGAEARFKSAYDASKDPRLLWDVAACEKGQHHYARTGQLVHEYLDEGKDLLDASDRQLANALIATIDALVVKLDVTVDQPGADVAIDDAHVGASPLASAVIVDPGGHKITVHKQGFKEAMKDVRFGMLDEGHERNVSVTLEPVASPRAEAVLPAPAAQAAPAPQTVEKRSVSPLRPIGITVAALGLVGIGAGTAFAMDAKSKQSASGCPQNVCPNQTAADVLRQAKSSADASTVFFVVGAVLAAGGVTTWLVAPSSKVHVAPSVGLGSAGVVLQGAW